MKRVLNGHQSLFYKLESYFENLTDFSNFLSIHFQTLLFMNSAVTQLFR